MIDLGGQWGGNTQYLFGALSDELNLKRYRSYYDGKGVFVCTGTEQEKEATFKLWKELFLISKSISTG